MVPEYWLTEGGQSATGALLDHIIEDHVASAHLANRAASRSEIFLQTSFIHNVISGTNILSTRLFSFSVPYSFCMTLHW